jgi:HemY protein
MGFWLRALWFVAKATVLALAVVWLAGLGGAVSLTFGETLIETTVGMLAVAGLAIAVAAILLYRIVRAVADTRQGIRRGLQQRRLKRGYQALADGFSALAAGQPQQVREIAARLEAQAETRPLAIFLAAMAARESGDAAGAAAQFRKLLDDKHAGFLGVRGLLTQAAQSGDRSAMPELIGAAHRLKPDSPWAAQAQFKLAVDDRRFEEAQSILQTAKRNGGIPAEEATRLDAALALELARRADAAGNQESAYQYARQAYRARPRFVPAVAAWADALSAAGKRRRAVGVLEEAWATGPHPALVRPFLAAAPDSTDLGRAAWAARLVSLTPDHPEALLAQADAALKAGLWGEAKRLLQPLLGASPPDRRALRLQAAFARAQPGGDQGTPEEWLAKAAETPPPASWRCAVCGTRHTRWVALCEGCGSFATLSWNGDGVRPSEAAAQILAPSQAFPLLETEPASLMTTAAGRNT